ncbi:MAG: hypothetical protein Q9184_006693 [Pyrenodesmia sp. 2 TL-2023]
MTDSATSEPRLQQSMSLDFDHRPRSYCSECLEVLPETPRAGKRVSNATRLCGRCKRLRKGRRKPQSEPTKPVGHTSAREVDVPQTSSARGGPVPSRTNPTFYVDPPRHTPDGAVAEDPAGPAASLRYFTAFCRRSASACISHATDVGSTIAAASFDIMRKTWHTIVLPFIFYLTDICRQLASAYAARGLHYRLPILLVILCMLSYVGLAIRMLVINRYASDQTLLDHAALVYATHASIPLLFSHILPALAFTPMFRIKEAAVRESYLAVKSTNCLRLMPRGQTCPYPTTREQSVRLKVSLNELDSSLYPLYQSVDSNLTRELRYFALPPISLYDQPQESLDKVIASTRNQSHVEEILIDIIELFDLPNYMDDSINARGLEPIEKYNIELERVAKDLLPFLEKSLSLLLSAHDGYDNLFITLDEIGLAHYADPLKQILSEGVEEGEEGDGKGQSWGGYLKKTFTGRSSTTRIPVVSLSTVLSSSLYHYYSIYTLLYSIRCHNILLYKSAVSYIPAQLFNPVYLDRRKTFFTSLPFRQPITKMLNPLGLTKEENDTALSLARGILARGMPIPPADAWGWEHASTAQIRLRPFPSQIPCPWGLMYPAGSPSSFLCNESQSYMLEFPNATEGTATWNKLLGLSHLRNVFKLIHDGQGPYVHAVAEHAAWVKGRTG